MTRRQGRRHHRERLGDSGSRTSLALKDHAQVRQDREAGSIIPPLTLACLVRVPFLPLTLLSHIGQTPGRTIALIGLERFFVPQQNTDLCWAAALQTARAYLGLQNVSFDEIPAVIIGVRLKAKQIQLVIVLCSIVSVGLQRKCSLYRHFFEYCHRKHLHQCVE